MDRKEQILLDSFNLLKDNVEKNHEQLTRILAQLQESQPSTVIELWKYLLESNWNKVVRNKEKWDSISSYLTCDIMYKLEDYSGFEELGDYLVKEPKVLKAVYRYAPRLPTCSTRVIGIQLRKKNWDNANKIIECMFENKKNDFYSDEDANESYSSIFGSFIERYLDDVESPEETFDLLNYWVEKIEDAEERARTSVYLAEILK